MTYLEKMRQIAADASKTDHDRFKELLNYKETVRDKFREEKNLSPSARTVSQKEFNTAWLIRGLGFIPGKYPSRVPEEKWSPDSHLFIAAVLEFIDSPFEEYYEADLPRVKDAYRARNARRELLHHEGYFDDSEAYDWGTSEGNDGY